MSGSGAIIRSREGPTRTNRLYKLAGILLLHNETTCTPKVGIDLVILDTLSLRKKALRDDVDVDIINVIVVGTQED